MAVSSPSTAPFFTPPAIPWLAPKELELLVDLGPGLDPQRCGAALARLGAEPDVRAVVAFGSRARGEARADSDLDLAVILHQPQLTGAEKLACWQRAMRRGPSPCQRREQSCWRSLRRSSCAVNRLWRQRPEPGQAA